MKQCEELQEEAGAPQVLEGHPACPVVPLHVAAGGSCLFPGRMSCGDVAWHILGG